MPDIHNTLNDVFLLLSYCFIFFFIISHDLDGLLNKKICPILVSGNIQLFLILSGIREHCPGQLMRMEPGTLYVNNNVIPLFSC